MTNLYNTIEVKEWKRIDELNNFYFRKPFAFRGQRESEWDLKTGIERIANRFSIELYMLPKIEKGLIRRFQRQAYLYLDQPPDKSDRLQWLALMQHYGAPTRLLDWTYSFFIAVFFAIEDVEFEKDDRSKYAVWVIDRKWLKNRSVYCLPSKKQEIARHDKDLKNPKTIDILFDTDSPVRSVYQLNPFRLNQRLILQQGLFLASGDVSQTFMYNFENLSEKNDIISHLSKIEIHLKGDFLKEALERLYRMNISRATLFPGLDGFTVSLKNQIHIDEVIVSHALEDLQV